MAAIFVPNHRAGKMNAGSRTRLSRVSCQDMLSIAASTNTMVSELLTTFCRVDVNACCAPSTSPLSRWTRAPVLARLKNASGMRCTWSNTSVRRSWIRPSPTWAETQRSATDRPAVTIASTATMAAMREDDLGVAGRDAVVDEGLEQQRGHRAGRRLDGDERDEDREPARYGRANRRIRFRVSRVSLWSATVRSLAKLRMLGLPVVIDTGATSLVLGGLGLVGRW